MSVNEKALQQARERMQAYQASLEAERQARAAKQAEQNEWLARIAAMRERIAQGETFEAPPSMSSIFTENLVQAKAEEKQQQRERLASPYAFTGDNLPQPPHVVKAWRKEFFAQHNAEYADLLAPTEEKQA